MIILFADTSYVYIHTRLDTNEIFYVGVGTHARGPYKRANETSNRNKWWRNIVRKVGYSIQIVFDNLTYDQARIEEINLIKKYGRKDLGTGTLVNMTHGGDGSFGRAMSPAAIEKIRKFQLGKPKSQQTIERSRKAALARGISPEQMVND